MTLQQVLGGLAIELDPEEQVALAHTLLELNTENASEEPEYDWLDLEGMAPNLLEGEDAQTWVSRTRKADTETREARLKRE